MIGSLRGTVLDKSPPMVVVDCGGVGYELWAPMPTFERLPGIGDPVRLLVHMVVTENAHTLYGFASKEDRSLFRDLIRVGGVGGKNALAVMSTLSASELQDALENGDLSALVKVPGIGKKTAQRILVDLREMPAGARGIVPLKSAYAEVEKALLSLGYSRREARGAIDKLPADSESENLETRIRLCLRLLSK